MAMALQSTTTSPTPQMRHQAHLKPSVHFMAQPHIWPTVA
eukprot:CAMPEP_0119510050 /NCGR_PEP_ID=MMETSP1344-20130328/29148_1 /TAXON_ID=236787 /ORGANISM="Florenciella parvula, Strain CCMP2471" /LENGTH=39 /DNA_ID= /DNA_START= /DNA_END= /DNA_ORIENTATION=